MVLKRFSSIGLMVSLIFVAIALQISASHPAAYADDQSGTPTPVPISPTATRKPTKSLKLKPGHWAGRLPVSFDVATDGSISNFSIVVPFGHDGACTITADKIALEANNTFVISKLSPALDQNFVLLMTALGIPTPTPIQTDTGEMFEIQRVSGKFISPTTLTGTYMVNVCENKFSVSLSSVKDNKWTAKWTKP